MKNNSLQKSTHASNRVFKGQKPRKWQKAAHDGMSQEFSEKFEQHVLKLSQAIKLSEQTKNPSLKLYKEGPGGTLEQVGREADSAMEGVKRIMALLNVEGKVSDFTSNPGLTWNGVIYDLTSNITQAIGDSSRSGDSLKVTRIRAKMYFNYATAAVAATVVLGRSKDGVPSIANVFENVGTIYSGLTFENHDQRKADMWLKSRSLVINNVDDAGTIVEFDIKGDVDTTYANATTVVTSNCYWLALICNQVAGGAVYLSTRLDFVDN